MPLVFFIAIMAAALVVIAGVFCEWLARRYRLRGYSDVAAHVCGMAAALRGEVGRDGDDLLLRVNIEHWPVLVRFSNSDGQPRLNIRVPVAGKLAFYCAPRGKFDTAREESLPTGDVQFDSRFRVSASERFLGRTLLDTDPVPVLLKRICCSPRTFLSMEDKYLEVSELTTPAGDLGQHVGEHMADLARLARITRSVVGVGASHIKPFRPAPNWLRLAYCSMAVGAIIVGFWLGRPTAPVQATDGSPIAPKHIIPPAESALIPNLSNWRLLETSDSSLSAIAYLQQQGLQPEGHIAASFSGSGADSAYVLVNTGAGAGAQPMRVVLIVKQQVRFDANMPHLDVAARIPKSRLAGIEWKGRAPMGEPDGDGLLLVRNYADPASGMILYWSGVQLVTASPKDFHLVVLQ
ncbi:MAG: hypothetical protein ACXVZT_08955 [Terriglobales bacterium]